MNWLSKWFKKYFIPHEGNGHHPHFLRHKSMLFFFILTLIVEIGFLAQILLIFNQTNFLASVLPGVLTALTNEKRADNHEAPLTENELLKEAALLKAQDMANRSYFAHVSPDGKTPWYWLEQVGYKYTSAGENLAVNFFESSDVADAWMNSPSHRANILKNNYKEIGIGVARGTYEGRSTVFVAQFFGTPMVVASPITPEETTPEPAPSTPAPSSKTTTVPNPTPKPKVTKPTTPAPTPPVKVTPPEPTPEPSVVATAPTQIQVLGEETVTPAPNPSLTLKIKSFVRKALTSPREYASYILATVLLITLFAILLFLFVKSELAHPFVIARGVALVAVIFLLMFINFSLLTPGAEVPTDNLSANVIAY